ncbi:MAG: hypothetical protein KGJ49_10110 [Alphaproteobacteria bacterium]|nr:hypothetical protein [Alphaproteobacteria bacterium]
MEEPTRIFDQSIRYFSATRNDAMQTHLNLLRGGIVSFGLAFFCAGANAQGFSPPTQTPWVTRRWALLTRCPHARGRRRRHDNCGGKERSRLQIRTRVRRFYRQGRTFFRGANGRYPFRFRLCHVGAETEFIDTKKFLPPNRIGLGTHTVMVSSPLNCSAAFVAAALVASALQAQAAPQADTPSYTITKNVALGAPDRWDYVVLDPVLNRVYVSHSEKVTVVDGTSGAIVGTINGITGTTHGIASVHALGKGYTDDGKAGIAVSFDLKTLKIINSIKAEPDADGIVFDQWSGHILVIDGGSGKITVIDPKTDTLVATVDGGGGLEFGVSGENGKFYVDGAEKGEIVRIDTKTNTADAHWPMAGCQKPHGLAIDRAHMRLFASCANKVMAVVDAETGAVLATLPIGEGSDFAEFDPSRGLAFSSNRDGTLSIIVEKSPATFVALPAVTTELGARTMAIDPKTGRVFLVTADMTLAPAVPPSDARPRYSVKPGSAKLLFLDPMPQ